jgi:hypothetical protein
VAREAMTMTLVVDDRLVGDEAWRVMSASVSASVFDLIDRLNQAVTEAREALVLWDWVHTAEDRRHLLEFKAGDGPVDFEQRRSPEDYTANTTTLIASYVPNDVAVCVLPDDHPARRP